MKQPSIKVLRVWPSMILSVVGIIGMRFVSDSIISHRSPLLAVMGTILVVASVTIVGTPLAYAMYLRQVLKAGKRHA